MTIPNKYRLLGFNGITVDTNTFNGSYIIFEPMSTPNENSVIGFKVLANFSKDTFINDIVNSSITYAYHFDKIFEANTTGSDTDILEGQDYFYGRLREAYLKFDFTQTNNEVLYLTEIFRGCKFLEKAYIETGTNLNLDGAFKNCHMLTDITIYDTRTNENTFANIKSAISAFDNSELFTSTQQDLIDLSTIEFTNLMYADNMFSHCLIFKFIDTFMEGSALRLPSLVSASGMFYGTGEQNTIYSYYIADNIKDWSSSSTGQSHIIGLPNITSSGYESVLQDNINVFNTKGWTVTLE